MKHLIISMLALLGLPLWLHAQADKTIPEAVDLGLSVKWADRNVGALEPAEPGNLYAWGEVLPKEDYSWMSYKWTHPSYQSPYFFGYRFEKYIPNETDSWITDPRYQEGDYSGFEVSVFVDRDRTYWTNTKRDGLTRLKASDDAASMNINAQWRTPTAKEWEELMDNCTFVLTDVPGILGFKLTSKKNGNSIFLPVTGRGEGTMKPIPGFQSGYFHSLEGEQLAQTRGYYWSSDVFVGNYADVTDKYTCRAARYFYFNAAGTYDLWYLFRFFGLAVRPVLDN